MKPLQSSLITLTIALGLSTTLTACQPKSDVSAAACSETDVSVRCLLEYAQNTLDGTEDSFVGASGAAELAVAYDAAGKTPLAVQVIDQAIERARLIEDKQQRGVALGEIATSLAEISVYKENWRSELLDMAEGLEARSKAELVGKIVVINAVHVDAKAAFTEALALPHAEDVEGYAKVITLRKIANILAKNGDFDDARQAIDSLTMSIDYYKSMARTDVARIAFKKGEKDLAQSLIDEADPIARSLGNGYFVGAALRDIGYSYQKMGMTERAKAYFAEAVEKAAQAEKQNEKARATSRIATRMADAGLTDQIRPVLKSAAAHADAVENAVMKGYSYYEITGSAGIAGHFDLSRTYLEKVPDKQMGSSSSIRSSAKRDLAWGLARAGKTAEAMEIVRSIAAPRERIHAVSRIIRVVKNPDMVALPRYL